MAEKQGDLRSRTVGWLAAAAAGFVARKLTIFAWTRITGKEPPANPQDPEVRLAEAIGFAVVMSVGMEVTRLLVTRAAAKRVAARPTEPAD